MAKRRRKKELDGGKLFLGLMTGGLSLPFTGIHKDKKRKKKGMSFIDDRWCDRASWF